MSVVYDQHALSPRLRGRFPMDRCPATMTIENGQQKLLHNIDNLNQSMGRLHVVVVSRFSPGMFYPDPLLTRWCDII